jgi:LPS-assembly lipoprotein
MAERSFFRTGLLLLALALLLQGCGFKLREASRLPSSISPVYIQGLGEFDALRLELVQQINLGGVQVTDDREAAGSRLQVSQHRSDKRTLAVDSSGKVIEYELHEQASFRLLDPAGLELATPQRASVLRTQLDSGTRVLARQNEEQMLRQEMRKELAGQMIRRLQSSL